VAKNAVMCLCIKITAQKVTIKIFFANVVFLHCKLNFDLKIIIWAMLPDSNKMMMMMIKMCHCCLFCPVYSITCCMELTVVSYAV